VPLCKVLLDFSLKMVVYCVFDAYFKVLRMHTKRTFVYMCIGQSTALLAARYRPHSFSTANLKVKIRLGGYPTQRKTLATPHHPR